MQAKQTLLSAPSIEIPVCAELLALVRTLDCFNTKDTQRLSSYLTQIVNNHISSDIVIEQSHPSFTPEIEHFLQCVVTIHQTLALVNVDYTKFGNPSEHVRDVIQ
jgi:hypothetical protein